MERELQVSLELARAAGKAVKALFGKKYTIRSKGADGPVTAADEEADALIRAGLQQAFPDDPILSEETPDDPTRLASSRLWLVDPLDGTQQFVDGIGEYAVMIGLAVDGDAEIGVIDLPEDDLTVFGSPGRGAGVIDAQGRLRPLTLEPWPESLPIAEKLRLTVSRTHAGSRTQRLIDLLAPGQLRRSGSVGRKACLVALGEVDAYVSLGRRSSHWDACAADAILRCAGGSFSDLRGQPISYNSPAVRNRHGLLAARAGLAARLVEAAAAVPPPAGAP